MDTIPNEILSEIFGALADIASPRCIISAPSFSECLLSVRNAHDIMLGTSSRWRALSLSNSHFTHFEQSYIDAMRTRCGVHPLTILCWANHTSMHFMIAFENRSVSLWLFGKPTFDARDLHAMTIRELRIDGSSVNYFLEKIIVLHHLRLLEGLRVHYATVPHPIIRAEEFCNLRTLALQRILPIPKLDVLGKRLETLILHGVYKLMYTETRALSPMSVLPHVRSLDISPPESDSRSPYFTGVAYRVDVCIPYPLCLQVNRLRLPHVTPHVLSVLMQCDETLADVSLIGSRTTHHDLPRTILEYIAGEPGSAGTNQHPPHLRRLALQTSSAQIELLERMFFIRVMKWREMGVAMLESCRLFVDEENDYMDNL
ncbi:hypothetical protein BDZ89DRAFT_1133719 [Hymenopellis radicata]|nr:hypothetical protein BDZ89DRAFT_1133719 [Hymenopellis radicata]